MTVNPVQSTTTNTKSTSMSNASQITGNYNNFLQLLVTELKNQDPTKPLDPTQTVSQLATFSSVEQAVQTNALLSSLNDNSALSQGSALIGRAMTSADGSVSGTVNSITLANNGLIANLSDGNQLPVGSGVVIS